MVLHDKKVRGEDCDFHRIQSQSDLRRFRVSIIKRRNHDRRTEAKA